MEKAMEIAMRIAELREDCGYSREELAAALGVAPEVYAGYEESGRDIPISVIFQIANMFNVEFTELLTGTAAKLDTYHLVRAGEGRTIERYPGYHYQDLGFRFSHKIMQPLLVTLDPSDEPAALVRHTGQEFNYVVEGTVIVTFDGRELVLNRGDSVYFNPERPHGQRCGGATPAVFLTMIAE